MHADWDANFLKISTCDEHCTSQLINKHARDCESFSDIWGIKLNIYWKKKVGDLCKKVAHEY